MNLENKVNKTKASLNELENKVNKAKMNKTKLTRLV